MALEALLLDSVHHSLLQCCDTVNVALLHQLKP